MERHSFLCHPRKRAIDNRQPIGLARKLSKWTTRKWRGQAAVELALVLPVALIILLGTVQLALIGQIALALGQMNYQAARFAAVHPDCDVNACSGGETSPNDSITDYVQSVRSPTIDMSKLTITASPSPLRTFGQSVTVNLSYDASGNIVLPNPFLGIRFPTTLTSSETAMSQ